MLKVRGLAAVLAAVPLVVAVPLAGAVAGPVSAREAPKPPKKEAPKPRKKEKRRVVLRTDAPERDVAPGGTYAWSFAVTPKGGKRAARAVFRATLPASLEFVHGRGCEADGRKVACELGKVKPGEKVRGAFRAKVSARAVPRREIAVRGAVTWGKARDTAAFPVVRVAAASRVEAATL
ncbi:hypothetical protein [Actinomadura sp. WMMB 499]|uniref:hypothetical protein n=1 Tax=Actinomadura sp. WMMB 499 TaxID=1219491 RepID=UPI00159DCB2C|nr:hypothetical protein [Actinomadura sp. WMMB 499]